MRYSIISILQNNTEFNIKKDLLCLKDRLIQELITSEIKYISYMKKLIKMHTEIFGRINVILNISETLLESMLTVGIEKAFLTISPCLKLYADYARRYQMSSVFLETCIAFTSGLFEFISRQENLPEINLQLSAILIMPIQRIPRYSLLLQDLLLCYLQLDGLTESEANQIIAELVSVTKSVSVAPEILINYILNLPYHDGENNESYLKFVCLDATTKCISKLSSSCVVLIAGFVSVVATSGYLNEQVRLAEQGNKAALLQSKLLGQSARNLILVPGRRLLRYGFIGKKCDDINEIQFKLLAILSDILVYATPKTSLQSELFPNVNKQCSYTSTKISNSSIRISKLVAKCQSMSNRLKCKISNKLPQPWCFFQHLLHSNSMKTNYNLNANDIITNECIKFVFPVVFPLHHCCIERHFGNVARCFPCDTILESKESLLFVETNDDLKKIGKYEPVASTPLISHNNARRGGKVKKKCIPNTSVSNPSLANSNFSTDFKAGGYSFSIHCRDACLTLVCGTLEEAERWISCLETAIKDVKTARQTLRKASSAKCPMRAVDFIQFEKCLNKKRIVEESALLYKQLEYANSEDCYLSNPIYSSNVNQLFDCSKLDRKLDEYRRRKSLSNPTNRLCNTSPSSPRGRPFSPVVHLSKLFRVGKLKNVSCWFSSTSNPENSARLKSINSWTSSVDSIAR